MDDPTMTQFGNVLMKRLAEVIPEMRGILSNLRNTGAGTEPMDEVDLTSTRYATEFLMLMQDRNKNMVSQIHEALRRIDTGEFGICCECGDYIEIERLRVQPMTPVCLECKKDLEALGKRRIC